MWSWWEHGESIMHKADATLKRPFLLTALPRGLGEDLVVVPSFFHPSDLKCHSSQLMFFCILTSWEFPLERKGMQSRYFCSLSSLGEARMQESPGDSWLTVGQWQVARFRVLKQFAEVNVAGSWPWSSKLAWLVRKQELVRCGLAFRGVQDGTGWWDSSPLLALHTGPVSYRSFGLLTP